MWLNKRCMEWQTSLLPCQPACNKVCSTLRWQQQQQHVMKLHRSEYSAGHTCWASPRSHPGLRESEALVWGSHHGVHQAHACMNALVSTGTKLHSIDANKRPEQMDLSWNSISSSDPLVLVSYWHSFPVFDNMSMGQKIWRQQKINLGRSSSRVPSSSSLISQVKVHDMCWCGKALLPTWKAWAQW